MSETSPAKPAVSDAENILCGCSALSLADLRKRVAEDPDLSFEKLLDTTGSGGKCTACLLDLEFHYVESKTQIGSTGKPGRKAGGTAKQAMRAKASLKQRFYKWLDDHSPLTPYPFNNTMPVLFGHGIEQWVWITNHSMLYEGKRCAPTMRMELIIRDAAGKIVDTLRRDVEPDSLYRQRLSTSLLWAAEPPAGQPGIGSVEIRRQGLTPGIRGTTRPQIEITTPVSACAVHSQALAGAGQYWFACLYRPQHEKMFFSLVNGADKPTRIALSYPADLPGVEPITHHILLAPRGAVLHQVALPDAIAASLGDRPMAVTWSAPAAHKVHAICSTPSLDRFSIDHL